MVNYINERLPIIKDKMRNLKITSQRNNSKMNPELKTLMLNSKKFHLNTFGLGTSVEDKKQQKQNYHLY